MMPFLSTLETAQFTQGVCDRSVGPAFTAVVEGHTFEFFRSDEVSYDFVLRVENNPATEVFRAADRAFAEFGVDLNIVRIVLAAKDREALDAGREDSESYGYAAVILGGLTGLVDYLRENGSPPVPKCYEPHRTFETDDGGRLGVEYVAVTADEQSGVGHGSSPELECGDSVRDAFSPVGWAKLTLRPPVRRYQQLPVQVDAVQWTGNNLGDLMVFVAATNIAKRGDRFCIEPPDAEATFAVPGDYVVRDAAGTYRCIPATAFQTGFAAVVSL